MGPYFAIGKGVAQAVTGLPRCKNSEYDREKVLETLMGDDTQMIPIVLLVYLYALHKRIYKRKKVDRMRSKRFMEVFQFMAEQREWLMLGSKKQIKEDFMDFRIGVLEVAKQRYISSKR